MDPSPLGHAGMANVRIFRKLSDMSRSREFSGLIERAEILRSRWVVFGEFRDGERGVSCTDRVHARTESLRRELSKTN